MKRRLWLVILQAVLAVVVAFTTFARGVQQSDQPHWLVIAAIAVKPLSLLIGLTTAALIATLQIIEHVLGRRGYRRDTIRKCLDGLVSQLGGKAKRNRVTVFKQVGAARAFVVGLWRLRWIFWQKNRRGKLRLLGRIRPGRRYLVVYVRSGNSRNPNSAIVLRVSDRTAECEGMAGLAWEEDFVMEAELPHLDSGTVLAVKDFSEVAERRRNDPLRYYVEKTGIKSLEQLRAFQQYARHFMGSTINRRGGEPWGVLLLDSEETTCPFPADEPDGGCFGKQFKACAETVFNLLK